MNPSPTTQRGLAAESLALGHLEAQGMTCIGRNYRCRLGELDLIMRDGAELVFVEVRYRADSVLGGAADTIGPAKKRRLLRAARHYLMTHDLDVPCRIDVVAIDGDHLEWIVNAVEEQ